MDYYWGGSYPPTTTADRYCGAYGSACDNWLTASTEYINHGYGVHVKHIVIAVITGLYLALFAGCGDLRSGIERLSVAQYGMQLINGDTYLMGADSMSQTAGTVNFTGDSIHPVTLTSFYIDSTEVTQGEFLRCRGFNPSRFRDSVDWAKRPVENVTWYDAVLYCNARSRSEARDTIYSYNQATMEPGQRCTGLGGLAADFSKNGYRLPTEAEWEFACKAGTMTNYWWGNDTNGMGECAWNYHNCIATQPVATKKANAFGLYDMAGNVFEWCHDWYGSYGGEAQTDPVGPAEGINRVVRGSAWYYFDHRMRSANRYSLNPDGCFSIYGFRCARRY